MEELSPTLSFIAGIASVLGAVKVTKDVLTFKSPSTRRLETLERSRSAVKDMPLPDDRKQTLIDTIDTQIRTELQKRFFKGVAVWPLVLSILLMASAVSTMMSLVVVFAFSQADIPHVIWLVASILVLGIALVAAIFRGDTMKAPSLAKPEIWLLDKLK